MIKVLASLLLTVMLTACGANRPVGERQSFLVLPERSGAPAAQAANAGLRLGRASIAPPFDSQAFIYRRDDVRYQSDFYNQFATDPPAMLAEAVGGWLRRSGLFRQVLPASSAAAADLRLEFDVGAMYIDFRTEPPAAVLEIRWQVLREDDRSSVLSLEAQHRAPLAERSPAAAARAYGKAMEEAFSRLEEVLARIRY